MTYCHEATTDLRAAEAPNTCATCGGDTRQPIPTQEQLEFDKGWDAMHADMDLIDARIIEQRKMAFDARVTSVLMCKPVKA